MTLHQERMNTIEQLIDSHGLASLLSDIAMICGDKADHIAASYDDKVLASVWAKRCTLLVRLATRVED